MAEKEKTFEIRDMDLYYGNFQALKKVNIDIYKNDITNDKYNFRFVYAFLYMVCLYFIYKK